MKNVHFLWILDNLLGGYAPDYPGRAAKILSQKTGQKATTIHKGIYSFEDLHEIETGTEENEGSFMYYYKLRNNLEVHNSILIIDEASMVSDRLSEGEFFRFGSGYLLNDLFEYAQIGFQNATTKIIFVGDPAQLPPIGMNFSPALDKDYLQQKFGIKAETAEIKEVKRQDANNGILIAASKIRKNITSGFFNDFALRENGIDIFNPKWEDFLETYNKQQSTKIIITYKNKTALDLNQTIRADKYGAELPIQKGDTIIIGGNNYSLDIMNGEFGIVADANPTTIARNIRFNKKNGGIESVNLVWRWIELVMPDDNGSNKTVKGYMLENYLYGDNFLKPEEMRALYVDFKNRHPQLKPKTKEFKEAIKSDQLFRCILLKFGYAVTCHKAQGGEWNSSFVFWDYGVLEDFNFLQTVHSSKAKTNSGFYRWAYTAVTRASKTLYCINPPCFNSFSGMTFIDIEVQNALQELTSNEQNPIEIDVKGEAVALLEKFNLLESPVHWQDHLLKIHYLVQKYYIEIISWNRHEYEIHYGFQRMNDMALVKFWFNGKNEFRPTFQKIPSGTNSNLFFEEISKIISNPIPFVFNRNTAKTIVSKIEFDIQVEEEKPFLKSLFDALSIGLANKYIEIIDVNHQHYRERYSVSRNSEKAIIDFLYDENGFFSRIEPREKQCNSESLLSTISQVISNLKVFDYVI